MARRRSRSKRVLGSSSRRQRGFFRITFESASVNQEIADEIRPTPAALLAVVSPPEIRRSVVVEPPQDFTVLSTQDLLYPSEGLRKSLESFVLDQRSEHTQLAYTKDFKRFLKYLRVRAFRRQESGLATHEPLTRTLLISYKDWLLSEKLEHTSIDRHLATLRSLFRWLVDDGLLRDNPAERVRFLNPKKLSKTAGFSDEEVIKVLKVPNLHTRTGSMHYAILTMLFYCGLRRSELANLRTSQISKERDHAVLRVKGKGNQERILPLVEVVQSALQHYLKMVRKSPLEDQFLFTPIRNNRTGKMDKPIDASMIYYIVTRYAKEAGIVHKVSPHSCRATAISNARDHQVADRAIQEFAGWTSTQMITHYDKRKTAIEDSAAHAIRYGAKKKDKDPKGL